MATQPAPRTTARTLEMLAGELHDAAFDFAEDAVNHEFAERRINRVEEIVEAARAAVRGTNQTRTTA